MIRATVEEIETEVKKKHTCMTSPHNNPIRIRKRLVRIIIYIKHTTPHRGPKIIRFQSEQKLKDIRVKVVTNTCIVFSWSVIVAASQNQRLFSQINTKA